MFKNLNHMEPYRQKRLVPKAAKDDFVGCFICTKENAYSLLMVAMRDATEEWLCVSVKSFTKGRWAETVATPEQLAMAADLFWHKSEQPGLKTTQGFEEDPFVTKLSLNLAYLGNN